ncbi:Leucine-rich transmembrane protein [Operophtera brumata]|uniref:Leucine-rich transmembrane protein n=1 Tax=Operophtera brumata TaxID=104452 RepID=A0A0L7KQC7_OPEBR|nr:Leucine-rich transmembrane protein [Operophtera brumata]
MTTGYCLHDKIQRYSNCSFHYQCHGNIGAQLPQECQEASNDPVTVDLMLIDAHEQFHDHIDQDFLSFVTTLTISGIWPQTKLMFLQFTTRLINLNLSGNQIEAIDGEAFFTLGSLETLDLSNNKLTKFDELFHFQFHPNKLSKLSLAYNEIKQIPKDAFEELTFLTELDLSNNYISDLTAEPFCNLTNLETLRLNHNKIKNLNGAVNNLQNLKHLYLRGNQIDNIDMESLKIIIHLETFDVSLNHLEKIKPMMFSRHWDHLGGHSVCKIIMSANHITSVPNATSWSWEITTRFARHLGRGRVAAVDVLTELDLSKNKISTIEYNAFQSLVKLNSLDLSKNRIIDFVVNATDIALVRYLNLSNNYISTLYFESFSRMKSLQNLDLSHNKLDYIPDQTFDNNNDLRHVNMTFNEIEKLDNLHINKFHPGGILDLSNNGLTQLGISPGEGRRLAVLVLHSNNITDPSLVDLWYLTDLKNLDMSRNQIRELDESSLRLPVVLYYLDLSCNLIEKIGPSTFLRIGHLKTLRLAHNHLTSIEYGAFRGLSSLLNLDLSFNSLRMVDSKLFMDLKSLLVLSLRHNELLVLKDEAWYGHKFNLKVHLEGNNFTCEWLGEALKNYNNGYSKMRPTVLEMTISGHSLDGIPCIPGHSELANLELQASGSGMTDDRLLIISQKILEAVREQTYYLKKFTWRSLQEDAERAKAFV